MELSERQIEIIEAASRLLTRQGLLGLTIKNLAVEMSFSEGAIYRHFTSKEEIIATMLDYFREQQHGRLTDALVRAEGPEEQLLSLFRHQFAYFAEHPHWVIVILSEGLMEYTPEVQKALLRLMSSKKEFLDRIVQQGQACGYFTSQVSAEFLVHTLMGTFRLLILKWQLMGFCFDLPREGEHLLQQMLILLRGKKN